MLVLIPFVSSDNLSSKNIYNDSIQPIIIPTVDLEPYLSHSSLQDIYEVKKIGNGNYEYIGLKDGNSFNSISEFIKPLSTKAILGFDFENRINLSSERVGLLVSLRQDLVDVQKELNSIKAKYTSQEDIHINAIREISSQYSSDDKRVTFNSNVLIEISDVDLVSIKDNGRSLEKVRGLEINEIKNKLYSSLKSSQDDFTNWIIDNGGLVKRELNGFVSVDIPLTLLTDLLERSDVYFVDLDENIIKPLLSVSTPSTNVDSWWAVGYNGSWSDAAVVDSGVDETHPALDVDIDGVPRTFISQDFTESGTSDDELGHGTHCAGIIASSDSPYTGVSPGVDKIINAKHLGGVTSDTLGALDWAINNGVDPAEVLSNSWGLNIEDDCNSVYFSLSNGNYFSYTLYMDALVDYYDVISVISAGNDGFCGASSVLAPADCYNGIAVGAINDEGTLSRSDDLWLNDYFASAIGPTADGRKKPDIVAPGFEIKSAAHDWEGGLLGINPDYVSFSGTSMAAPHVSGAANLLIEYGLSSKGVKALLINTAEDKGAFGWDAYYGWGLLDLNKSYVYRDYVLDSNVTENSYIFYKVELVLAGEKATLVWNKHNV